MAQTRRVIAFSVLYTTLSFGPAYAIEPIPDESGLSGFLSLGAAYNSAKTNMIAGNSFGDVGNSAVDSLTNSPDSNKSGSVNFNFDLRYTFASPRTQLFVGNSLENALRYDFATQLGVAQELPGKNLVAASLLFSSIPTEVWRDPYVLYFEREETDRKSTGIRLAWDRILGSELQLQYSYRKIELDDEYSGIFLGLSPSERDLLDREGKVHKAETLYRFFFDSKKHTLIPAVIYTDLDLDGDAMANDGLDFQLSYGYNSDNYSLVVNVLIGYEDYDKVNPIYFKKRDEDHYGAGLIGFYHNPFGWSAPGFKRTSLYFKTDYLNSDSNIDFYDTEIFSVGTGLFFRF